MGASPERAVESSPGRLRGARFPSPSTVERARVERSPVEEARVRGPRSTPPIERAAQWLRRWGLSLLLTGSVLAYLSGCFGVRGALAMGLSFVPLAITVLVATVWRLLRLRRGELVKLSTDAQLALLGLQLAFALTQLTGDLHSALYPAVYLVAAFFAVAPWPRSLALALVAWTVAENALRYACADVFRSEWQDLVVQTGFVVVFAVLYHSLLAARLVASRAAEQQAVSQRLREAEDSARRLRLIVADRSLDRVRPGDDDLQSQRLLLGAVLEVERSVGSIIEGAHIALGNHAIALFWLADDEATIHLRDGRCPAGLLRPGPLSSGDGILGSVLRHGQSVSDTGKLAGVNWYTRAVPVRAIAAVPVIERVVDGTGYVRGVLIADRLEAVPFPERDVVFLEEIATQIARASEAERLVGELHRSKEAQDRLHRAAEELNCVSTMEEVATTAVRLAKQLVPGLDVVALTRVDGAAATRTHVVCAAQGNGAGRIDGLIFDDNDGLVSSVVRLKAPMPPKAPGVLERVKLFDEKVGGLGSLRVAPLTAGTRVLGTLVAGASARAIIESEGRQRLDDLATLVAGACSRALALEEVSRLALSDGLTGLANRRQLDILAQHAFRDAVRYVRPISVLMTDVDHFKKVNDTHGHSVGDEVLKSVAAVLREEARAADVVGRYGGEEFVVVLGDTDTKGAVIVAERIRKRLESSEMKTSAGVVRVTLSLGIATYPKHRSTLAELLQAADEALYLAKSQGRNRVVAATASPAHKEEQGTASRR
jgi:two-component system cell cycle response regulator